MWGFLISRIGIGRVLFVLGLDLLSQGMLVVIPLLIRRMLSGESWVGGWQGAGAVVTLVITRMAIYIWRDGVVADWVEGLTLSLKEELIPSTERLGPRAIAFGDLFVNLSRDVERIRSFLAGIAFPALSDVVYLGLALVGALIVFPQVILPLLVFIGVVISVYGFYTKRMMSLYESLRETLKWTFRYVSELMQGWVEAWIYELDAVLAQRLREAFRREGELRKRLFLLSSRLAVISEALVQVGAVAVLVLLLSFRSALGLSLGDVVAGYMLVSFGIRPVVRLVSLSSSLAGVKVAWDRIESARRSLQLGAGGFGRYLPNAVSLKLSGVGFWYEPGRWLFRGLSAEVAEGRLLLITGPNGSGKTTLMKLMLGMLTPKEGSIRIGGVSSADLDWRRFRRVVGVLWAEEFFTSGTVEENLRVGLEDFPRQKALEMMRLAGLEGIDLSTPIDPAGKGLSRGQRRRLGLIRALLRGKRLLVLDEVFANLDSKGREWVVDVLSDLKGKVTVVVSTNFISDELLALAEEVVRLG